MALSKYHVIVIGGGWYGIAAVKTYLQLDPDVSILLLDNGPSLGGVWSKSRVYPHLYANQPAPVFEYPDFSMKEALGIEDWTDLSGAVIAQYIDICAEKFGVKKHCRLNTQVVKIDRDPDLTWRISIQDTRDSQETGDLQCTKLIMALGHTSIPRFPENLDTSRYTGQISHMKEIAACYESILADKKIKNITVVGGSKSAWEAAGLFAIEGKHGKKIRALSAMAPTVYNAESWLTRFLYGVGVGEKKSLKPLTDSMFWLSSGLSMSHPHDERIYDLIDEGKLLNISRNSITSAEGTLLKLADGTMIESDMIVFATGWTHPLCNIVSIFPPDLALELELPLPISDKPEFHKSHWSELESEAISKVHSLYPILRSPPKHLNLESRPVRKMSHIHHFRCMVPPRLPAKHDRNIVFFSNVHTGNTPVHSIISSLWAFAYLEDTLPKNAPVRGALSDITQMEKDTAWEQSYFRIRYLDIFEGVTLSAFESRERIDRLLIDLGLRHDRHGMLVKKTEWFWNWKAWWKEWFGNYNNSEYATIVSEFLEVME